LSQELISSVLSGRAGPGGWNGVLPADFLPGPLENASVFPGRDNWILLAFPGCHGIVPSSLAEIRPGHLPHGAVLVRPLGTRIGFTAPVPFGLDVHWMKEIADGLLRGATGIRVGWAGAAAVRGEWSADWFAAVRREDVDGQPGIRVAVARRAQKEAGASAHGTWTLRAQAQPLARPDEVAGALLGIHPLNWVRGLFRDLGSRRVETFVKSLGSTLRAFDALREFWVRMGSRAEAALWEMLEEPQRWKGSLAVIRHISAEAASLAPALQELGLLPAGQAAQSALHWLQEMSGNGVAGVQAEGWRAAAQELTRLLEKDGVEPLLLSLPEAARRELNREAPGDWARDRLEELFSSTAANLKTVLDPWLRAAEKLAAPAAEAVARQWELRIAAALSASKGEATAADATFRLTEAGLAAAARLAQGDVSPVLETSAERLRLRRALLTETFSRRFFLELHAPLLRVRRKQRDLESFASAEACATEDGRLQVRYTAQASDTITTDLRTQTALVFSAAISASDGEARRDHFSLSFTNRRQLDPATVQAPYLRVLETYGLGDVVLPGVPCTATLHLQLPGTCVEAWMDTPSPVSPEYLPAMSRLAQAVQGMARRWLPALYLARLEAFSRPSAVHPLLAWSCSPPCSGPRKKDLSYDFMDPKVVDAVLQACSPAFRERLAEIWTALAGAGRKQTAAYYEPADTRYILASVRRQHRNFVSLLVADAFLVEAVLNVAHCAREVDRLVRAAPKAAVGEMARFSREMAETFHRRLRRLYAGDDFLALGPLFFLTATSALAGASRPAAEIAAVLTLEHEGGKTSYSNAAALRLL
jgi:hypothetical protein